MEMQFNYFYGTEAEHFIFFRRQMDMFANKFNELRTMLETEDIDGMRKMMRHSTSRRALFDKK